MAQEPEGQQPSLEELEAELARLRRELDHYQQLIEQTPAIYEEKFRHRVREVALEIRRLLDVEQHLKQQVAAALAGERRQARFTARTSPAVTSEPPGPPAGREPERSSGRSPMHPLLRRLPRQHWPLFVALAAVVAVATAILSSLRGDQPSPAAAPGKAAAAQQDAPPALRLRGRGFAGARRLS